MVLNKNLYSYINYITFNKSEGLARIKHSKCLLFDINIFNITDNSNCYIKDNFYMINKGFKILFIKNKERVIFINIVGFIIFLVIGSVLFRSMNFREENNAITKKRFANSPKAIVTVDSFYKEIDRSLTESYGILLGYRYVVSFIDENGVERLGISNIFRKKLLLKEGQQEVAHYVLIDKSEIGAFKNYDYDILFCNEEIYRLEKENDKKVRKQDFIWGICFVVIAFIILFFGHKK